MIEGTLALRMSVSEIGYNIEIHVPPTVRQSQKMVSTQKSLSQSYSFDVYDQVLNQH